MEACSMAERRRIIALFESGLEGEEVAEIVARSASGVRRVYQRYREEGRIGPRPHAGGQAPRLDDETKLQVLTELVSQKPDAFCRELADELFDRTGVRVCRQTVGSWLTQLGLTRKKSRSTPPSRSVPTSKRSGRTGSIGCTIVATATSIE